MALFAQALLPRGRALLVPFCLVLAAASPTLAAPPPADAPLSEAPSRDGAAAYEACLGQVRANAPAALATAEDWTRSGGGAPADHCAGLALVEMGRLDEAAARLEIAAGRATRSDLKADLLAQAGNVWLMAEKADRAEKALGLAIGFAPDRPDILVDRARALGARQDWAGAKRDLDAAIRRAPRLAEALVLRAGARRRLGDLKGARADADAALAAAPGDPAALLERGAIRHLAKDDKGAEADWKAVLQTGADGPEADAARTNLEALAAGGEEAAPAPAAAAKAPAAKAPVANGKSARPKPPAKPKKPPQQKPSPAT